MFKASPACGAAAMLVGVLAGAPIAARAQVYKCPLANGTVGYQSTPCATHEKPASHPTAAQLNAARDALPKAEEKPYVDPYARTATARPRAAEAPLPSVAAPPRNEQRAATEEDRRRLCTIALNNQSVLKQQGQAYSFDKAGHQQMIANGERERLYVEAERVAAANCR